MAMLFHRSDEWLDDCLQTLAANPVRRLPENDQAFGNSFFVHPASRRRKGRFRVLPGEQADRVLRVKSCDGNRLVQNLRFLSLRPT